jgi:ABC-type polysaccharide/polyol phosphate export permease
MLVFFHHIVTLLAAMAILNGMGKPVLPTVNMLYVFPALGILLVAGFGFGLFVAVLGARFRDLQHALGMSAGFLMIFTPILWRTDQLQTNEWVYQYNPLYYFIRLVRDPLLQLQPPPEVWIGAGIGAAVLFVLGFVTFWFGRRNLYHWM